MFAFVLLLRAPNLEEKGQGRFGQLALKQPATFQAVSLVPSLTSGTAVVEGFGGGADPSVAPL